MILNLNLLSKVEITNFFQIRKNKTYFSLNKYVKYQLISLGIKKIDIINKDTYNKKTISLVLEDLYIIKKMIMVEIYH